MNVEVPYALSKNPRDRRGFPIPYTVLRDDAGVAHFTINDAAKVKDVLDRRLCALCGKPHKFGAMWFIGGAGAAFHEDGLYADPPVHEDCGRFAVRVCPYIAAPNYGKRIDARTLNPDNVPDTAILADNKMDVKRPPFFVLSKASGCRVIPIGQGQVYIQPRRPWRESSSGRRGSRSRWSALPSFSRAQSTHPKR